MPEGGRLPLGRLCAGYIGAFVAEPCAAPDDGNPARMEERLSTEEEAMDPGLPTINREASSAAPPPTPTPPFNGSLGERDRGAPAIAQEDTGPLDCDDKTRCGSTGNHPAAVYDTVDVDKDEDDTGPGCGS